MENVSAGPKGGREETPVFYLECSDTWKTCSLARLCSQVRATGDTHSGQKNKKKQISQGKSIGQQGGYRLVQPRACYVSVSLLIHSE